MTERTDIMAIRIIDIPLDYKNNCNYKYSYNEIFSSIGDLETGTLILPWRNASESKEQVHKFTIIEEGNTISFKFDDYVVCKALAKYLSLKFPGIELYLFYPGKAPVYYRLAPEEEEEHFDLKSFNFLRIVNGKEYMDKLLLDLLSYASIQGFIATDDTIVFGSLEEDPINIIYKLVINYQDIVLYSSNSNNKYSKLLTLKNTVIANPINTNGEIEEIEYKDVIVEYIESTLTTRYLPNFYFRKTLSNFEKFEKIADMGTEHNTEESSK